MTAKPKAPGPASLSPAERALKESLLPGEFRDVHLYAFTRKRTFSDGSIRIDYPQAVIAIGSILKNTDHFSKLLSSGFSEANRGSDVTGTIRQCALESEYDYETDSDLDESEYEDCSLSALPPTAGSSSILEGKAREDSPEQLNSISDFSKDAQQVEKHHEILIPSIAHRTLKACIFYLYTGKINFLPLTSEGAAKRQFALLTTSDAAPACSPKSMYRLAESYGISELQDLAYKEITSRLKPENIVKEAFSSFFARYDRLREHAVSFLSRHYSEPAVQQGLPATIERAVLGDMPHAGGVLLSLLGLRIAVVAPLAKTSIPIASEPASPSPFRSWGVAQKSDIWGTLTVPLPGARTQSNQLDVPCASSIRTVVPEPSAGEEEMVPSDSTGRRKSKRGAKS